MGNSLLVTLIAVPVTVLLASWAGFALTQLAPRPRRFLLGLTVVHADDPLPMVWVARFFFYQQVGILNTLLPLMAPALAATTPFTVLLAYRSFRRIPPVLFGASRMEGASALLTGWRVALPLVRSTTTARTDPGLTDTSAGHGGASSSIPITTLCYSPGAVVLRVSALLALALAQRPLLSSVDLAADR